MRQGIRPCPLCGQMRGIETYRNMHGEQELDYWECDCDKTPACHCGEPGGCGVHDDIEEPDYDDYMDSVEHNDLLRSIGYARR